MEGLKMMEAQSQMNRQPGKIGNMLLGFALILTMIAGLSFAAGLFWSTQARAEQPKREPRVIYPKKTELDFEGTQIEGEVRNPGEFYFQHRKEEKFDSLVKRRPNFSAKCSGTLF
jgi:hypothetical protein